MGRSDPAGFAARAARCQMLRESHLVEPGVLIPTFNALNKNASTREAFSFRWRIRRDRFERRCLRRSHPCRALRPRASRPNSALGRVCRTRGVVHTAYPCKIKKGPVWALFKFWRRRRDSNPRYVAVYTLSRRAPSTTRPPLRGGGV